MNFEVAGLAHALAKHYFVLVLAGGHFFRASILWIAFGAHALAENASLCMRTRSAHLHSVNPKNVGLSRRLSHGPPLRLGGRFLDNLS